MDKFAMVYEFNTDSPLITYKASKEIEAKNYKGALKLLSVAIEKFPKHATAYFLHSLASAHNNDFETAKDILSKGDDLFGEKSTTEYYLGLIEKIKRESEGISVSFDDTVNDVLNEAFIEQEDFDTESEVDLLKDDFDQSLKVVDNSETESIVTETLAEIYASQNNYDEAIDIFEKLKIVKPELKEKFENRIEDIKLEIENKKQKKFGN